jgi:hypothetical protein
MKMKSKKPERKSQLRIEDFDTIDSYLDACIYEARKRYLRELERNNSRHSKK